MNMHSAHSCVLIIINVHNNLNIMPNLFNFLTNLFNLVFFLSVLLDLVIQTVKVTIFVVLVLNDAQKYQYFNLILILNNNLYKCTFSIYIQNSLTI